MVDGGWGTLSAAPRSNSLPEVQNIRKQRSVCWEGLESIKQVVKKTVFDNLGKDTAWQSALALRL